MVVYTFLNPRFYTYNFPLRPVDDKKRKGERPFEKHKDEIHMNIILFHNVFFLVRNEEEVEMTSFTEKYFNSFLVNIYVCIIKKTFE